MPAALVPCVASCEIDEALNRALDLTDQALAAAASIRDGIAPDVRVGGHAWKLGRLSALAVNLTALCAEIDAADVAAGAGGVCRDTHPAPLSAAA